MSSIVEAGESPEHRRLVKSLIEYLNGLGFITTCAAYTDYGQCSEISKHVPDVEGKNTDEVIAVGEAKTYDDLDNDRTREQFKAFSNCTMKGGKSNGQTVPLYIATTT